MRSDVVVGRPSTKEPPTEAKLKRSLLRFAALAVVLGSWLTPLTATGQRAPDIIKNKTLANGLDVIVLPSKAVPIATVEICVKNGAFTEPPPFNGLSHLYEHMFFKGNAVIPNQEAYLARMRELGIVFNGTTSNERVNYYFTLPSDNLEAGLEFMRDAITTPKFDPDEFEKEKKVVIGEVDRNESSPYYWFSVAMDEKIWFEHQTRKDPLGDRETITTATVDKMRTMKDRYYHPNNSALLVSGDVDPEKVFALAEEIFGGWDKGPDPFEANPVPEHPPLDGNQYVIVEKDVQTPVLQLQWHGPSVDDDPKATFAADVLSYILSQPTSKFQKNLVESGITLNAGISYYTQRFTGPITMSAQAETANVEKALGAMLAELEKLTLPGYYSDEQLQSAKTILAIEDLYDRENMASFTHTVSFWWATASLDYYRSYVENLKSVTRADINRYVNQYILGKPFVAGVLLSSQDRASLGMSTERLRTLVAQVGATQ